MTLQTFHVYIFCSSSFPLGLQAGRMCVVIIPYEAVSSLWKQYWTQVFLFSSNTCFELTFLWLKLPSRFKYRVQIKDFCLMCVVRLKWRPEVDLILLYQNLKYLRFLEILSWSVYFGCYLIKYRKSIVFKIILLDRTKIFMVMGLN